MPEPVATTVARVGSVAMIAAVVIGYGLGTFPTALLVGRRFGFDPTAAGSGNPGASNTTRLGGVRAGALVLAGDAGKGIVAAALGYAAGGRVGAWAAGAAAVAGHMWPVTRGFRGGKGVATAAGVGIVAAPLVFAALTVIFVVVVKVVGKAAAGSVTIAALLPFVLLVLRREPAEIAIATGLAVAVIVRHRSNLAEMRAERRATNTSRR